MEYEIVIVHNPDEPVYKYRARFTSEDPRVAALINFAKTAEEAEEGLIVLLKELKPVEPEIKKTITIK